jgi:hypothetical protein
VTEPGGGNRRSIEPSSQNPLNPEGPLLGLLSLSGGFSAQNRRVLGLTLLGHFSSEITREVYLHSIPADARAAVEKVERLLNRPIDPSSNCLGKTEVR